MLKSLQAPFSAVYMPSLHRFRPAVFACICLWSACVAAAEPLKLVVPGFQYRHHPEFQYFYKVVGLALTKTASEGLFEISTYPHAMSAQRAIEELKKPNGLVNLIWNGTSAERERELLPVRVSLLRDLNNYRLLLIRKGDQPRFDAVRSLDDLKRLSAGMGMQWPDTDILRANGLPVVSGMGHAQLFRMLEVKRFDYAPRGLYEVWAEVALPENRGLAIENSLMLYYEMPFYVFVNKNNAALASRVERGLKIALADGSFDQLMASVPSFKRAMEEQRMSQRRLFVLPALRAVQ